MAKDFSKLKGLIYEKFKNQAAFCEEIGKPKDWLSRRLSGQTEFNADDIILVVNTLNIDPQNIHLYFFSLNVL